MIPNSHFLKKNSFTREGVMQDYQRDFIKFAIQKNVLRFGEFTLKSGRTSPYFFNAGLFNDGEALNQLGYYYAAALENSGIGYDVLFGPAYKGIPLVSATAIALATKYNKNRPYSFNRKELKNHGEGGSIVGAPLQGKVLIVDDVITAGTAIREVINIIGNAGAEPSGVLIALNRQERGQHKLSAIQEIKRDFGIPVTSIVNLDQILDFLKVDDALLPYADSVIQYRNAYGVNE